MIPCKPLLAPVLCVLVLMGCKAKETAPGTQTSDAGGTDAVSEPPAAAAEIADALSPEEGQPTWTGKGNIHFRGKVEWVAVCLDKPSGVIPVGADPRFCMRVTIESVEEKEAPLKAGETYVFAIHSPTKTFPGADMKTIDAAKGTYDFRASVERAPNGGLWFHWLEREWKTDKPAE
jgi:hypothetical protein